MVARAIELGRQLRVKWLRALPRGHQAYVGMIFLRHAGSWRAAWQNYREHNARRKAQRVIAFPFTPTRPDKKRLAKGVTYIGSSRIQKDGYLKRESITINPQISGKFAVLPVYHFLWRDRYIPTEENPYAQRYGPVFILRAAPGKDVAAYVELPDGTYKPLLNGELLGESALEHTTNSKRNANVYLLPDASFIALEVSAIERMETLMPDFRDLIGRNAMNRRRENENVLQNFLKGSLNLFAINHRIFDRVMKETQVVHFNFTEDQAHPDERVLMREGEAADCFYIISEGQVGIAGEATIGGRRHITDLGPGHLVGEMAFYKQPRLRTAEAVVTSDKATLLRVPYHVLDQIFAENAELKELFRHLQDQRSVIRGRLLGLPATPEDIRRTAREVSGWVKSFLKFSAESICEECGWNMNDFVIVVLGGLGRGDVLWASDIDVYVLPREGQDIARRPTAIEHAKQLHQKMMTIARRTLPGYNIRGLNFDQGFRLEL